MNAKEFVEKALSRVAEALEGDEATLAEDLDALVAKIDPNHDAKGRFASGSGGGGEGHGSNPKGGLKASVQSPHTGHVFQVEHHEGRTYVKNTTAPGTFKDADSGLRSELSVVRFPFGKVPTAPDLHAKVSAIASAHGAKVMKSDTGDTVTVLKYDDDQQMVWGWALVSVEKGVQVHDLQGDLVDTDELQHAVHGSFMSGGRVGKMMHAGAPVGEVVDSVVFTKELQDALDIDLGREGWFVGMKIHSPAVWKRVKAGELPAFSIGGEGERHPVNKAWSDAARTAAAEARKLHAKGDVKGAKALFDHHIQQMGRIDDANRHIANGGGAWGRPTKTFIKHTGNAWNERASALDEAHDNHNYAKALDHLANAHDHMALAHKVGKSADAPVMFNDVVKAKDAKGHGSNGKGGRTNAEGRPINAQGHPSVGLHLPTSHKSPSAMMRIQSARADAGSKMARESGRKEPHVEMMNTHAKLANKFREGGFTAKANHHDKMSAYHEREAVKYVRKGAPVMFNDVLAKS
jgi:hypothetical protein